MSEAFAAVLRLSGIRLSQKALEERLGGPVERYDDKKSYAQISIADGENVWSNIDACLAKYGPLIKNMLDGGDLQRVCLDIAYDFFDHLAGISRTVPASTARLAGMNGIDVMVSIYRAAKE